MSASLRTVVGIVVLACSACEGRIERPASNNPQNNAVGKDGSVPGTDPDGSSVLGDASNTDPTDAGTHAVVRVSGEGQSAVAGTELLLPLVVRVEDEAGLPAPGVRVTFSAASGGGAVNPTSAMSDASGLARTTATLGIPRGANAFEARLGSAMVSFDATAIGGMAYIDPAAGGKLRLVKNAATTPTTVVLDLVAATALTGYSAGFNLPLQGDRVVLALFEPGTVLASGTNPAAAKALIPSTGPLRGMLLTAQSQKADGQGAVANDAQIPAGAVIYSLSLEAAPNATLGVAFDGAALGPSFSAGLRDKSGTDVAAARDVAIGKLELR